MEQNGDKHQLKCLNQLYDKLITEAEIWQRDIS